MSCSIRSWAALAMLALVAWAPLSRAEVELTAANKSVSADGSVTSYTGGVTLKAPASPQPQIRAKAMRREKGLEILRGEVEIRVDTLVVRTQQASVERNDKFVVVKMDAAEVSQAGP